MFENYTSSKLSDAEKPKLFLSYSEKDSEIADIIEKKLQIVTNDGLMISKYTRLPYKESFKIFMNSIQEHDFVLCIVSDNYLKSQACMYEVGEVIKDHHYKDKILFVVLGENDIKFYKNTENFSAAKIYGSASNRLSYISYWKDRYEKLSKQIDEINDLEATRRAIKELKELGDIYRNDISEFIEYLAQSNGKNFEELYLNDFLDIVKWIFPDWNDRIFSKCSTLSQLFANAIEEIWRITNTDYNQIALCAKTSNYENGLIVFGDNVCKHKQRYRTVIMEGLMAKSFASGKILNIDNVETEPAYFVAVCETKSELIVPIEIQGNVIGVINSESEEKHYYSELIVRKICRIANYLAVALNRLGYIPYMDIKKIPYVHIDFGTIEHE